MNVSALVCFFPDLVGLDGSKLRACIGVDFQALVSAPIGEGLRIDVCLHDQVAVTDELFSTVFRHLQPLVVCGRQKVPIDKHGL